MIDGAWLPGRHPHSKCRSKASHRETTVEAAAAASNPDCLAKISSPVIMDHCFQLAREQIACVWWTLVMWWETL
ncbi:hypothetical protein PLEOSDRAFT_1069657 [Pleurotus ostreatus PC15]|uniref:Uncharacterized protein n=1 Tax=Pleurotus ostreatus (strain PC15) TaxID=1137138 RepID=A0A067P3Q7_PLEO1|nr:hypothetical protein PLEOSDRAFT_1069657 [Pleurotus ostreatus PC15]